MATIQDIFSDLGVSVKGLVKSVDEYVSKKDSENPRSFFSVILDVGSKQNIKINLPEGYDRSTLTPFTVVSLRCSVSIFNNQMRLDALK